MYRKLTDAAKRPCLFVSRKAAKARRGTAPFLRAFAPLREIILPADAGVMVEGIR
jgi:hypothetical protein